MGAHNRLIIKIGLFKVRSNMKKILFAGLLLFATANLCSAQVEAYPQGNGVNIEGYTLPSTLVKVTVTEEREVVLRGPYARYASQYLGVVGAAQSDKENYKVLGVSVTFIEEPDPDQTYMFDDKTGTPVKMFRWLSATAPKGDKAPQDADYKGAQLGNQNPFTDVGVSLYGTTQESPEEQTVLGAAKSADQLASEAAQIIYKIRQKRIEILCAEQGENVFGSGLEAALKEMQKIEDDYVALFLGKRYTQVTEKTFYVAPESLGSRAVAFRFSPAKGVVNSTDLSGQPYYLEFKEASNSNSLIPPKKASTRTIPIRIPKMANVTLIDPSGKTMSTIRIPVYQFGLITDAPVV